MKGNTTEGKRGRGDDGKSVNEEEMRAEICKRVTFTCIVLYT